MRVVQWTSIELLDFRNLLVFLDFQHNLDNKGEGNYSEIVQWNSVGVIDLLGFLSLENLQLALSSFVMQNSVELLISGSWEYLINRGIWNRTFLWFHKLSYTPSKAQSLDIAEYSGFLTPSRLRSNFDLYRTAFPSDGTISIRYIAKTPAIIYSGQNCDFLSTVERGFIRKNYSWARCLTIVYKRRHVSR